MDVPVWPCANAVTLARSRAFKRRGALSCAVSTPVSTAGTARLLRRCCRQKARISKIESELAKLERDMHQMKLENARLKSKVGGPGAWWAIARMVLGGARTVAQPSACTQWLCASSGLSRHSLPPS